MSDILTKEVNEFDGRVKAWLTAAAPEAADTAIAAAMATFDRQYAGTDAPQTIKALRDEHEINTRAKYDQARRDEAAALEKDHAAMLAGFTDVIAALRRAPREPKAEVDGLREVAALLRFQGRTLSDLLRVYTETSDTANATLIGLIENDRDAFRLKPDPDTDAAAVLALRQAIEARQLARVPEPVREAEARVQAMLSSLKVSELLRHFRSGKGVASVRGPMPRLHAV